MDSRTKIREFIFTPPPAMQKNRALKVGGDFSSSHIHPIQAPERGEKSTPPQNFKQRVGFPTSVVL